MDALTPLVLLGEGNEYASTSISVVPDGPSPQADTGSRRTKRYAPKVRTGCITCKKRRVKCDETRPKCLRCLNSDWDCGYAVPQAWLFEPTPTETELKAEATAETGAVLPAGAAQALESSMVILLNRRPAAHTFTADESRSMHFYLRRTGRLVSKYNQSNFKFWMEVLPMASHRYDSLKHIVIATALQDELMTCPTTMPKIERRLAYHFRRSLQLMAYSKPAIDNVLLNCLTMFYFESLRGNLNTVVLHVEAARKIIDEWRAKNHRATPEIHALVDMVDLIVDEARVYAQCVPTPPPGMIIDWEKLPDDDPYDSVEDAEHTLLACITNLTRPSGQLPLALVRANVVLRQWEKEAQALLKSTNISTQQLAVFASLLQIACALIGLLDQSSVQPQQQRWQSLHATVLSMPNLQSVRFRKPMMAVLGVLEERAVDQGQLAQNADLRRRLQRGVVYDR